jgi:hypothetical protein
MRVSYRQKTSCKINFEQKLCCLRADLGGAARYDRHEKEPLLWCFVCNMQPSIHPSTAAVSRCQARDIFCVSSGRSQTPTSLEVHYFSHSNFQSAAILAIWYPCHLMLTPTVGFSISLAWLLGDRIVCYSAYCKRYIYVNSHYVAWQQFTSWSAPQRRV